MSMQAAFLLSWASQSPDLRTVALSTLLLKAQQKQKQRVDSRDTMRIGSDFSRRELLFYRLASFPVRVLMSSSKR